MVDLLLQLVQIRDIVYLVAHWLMWVLWTCCIFINLLLAMRGLLIMALQIRKKNSIGRLNTHHYVM